MHIFGHRSEIGNVLAVMANSDYTLAPLGMSFFFIIPGVRHYFDKDDGLGDKSVFFPGVFRFSATIAGLRTLPGQGD